MGCHIIMRIIKSQQKQGKTFVWSLDHARPHCGQCPCYVDVAAEPSYSRNLKREVQFYMKDFDCLLWLIWQMARRICKCQITVLKPWFTLLVLPSFLWSRKGPFCFSVTRRGNTFHILFSPFLCLVMAWGKVINLSLAFMGMGTTFK